MGTMNVQGVTAGQQVPSGADGTEQLPEQTGQLRQEDESQSLIEMIQEAQKKAEAQRDALKVPRNTRYGDAPLEAYARLSRAKTQSQVSSAAGYARRRIAQLEAAQRSDPDHADQIRAAVGQLKKAVSRAGKKKMEINREQLARARQKRMARENRRREEQRIKQELRRSQSMRAIRESGYFRETEIANRQADQLTATKMELRAQAEQLGSAAIKSADAAAQEYAAAVETAAAVTAPVSMPQVDVQA